MVNYRLVVIVMYWVTLCTLFLQFRRDHLGVILRNKLIYSVHWKWFTLIKYTQVRHLAPPTETWRGSSCFIVKYRRLWVYSRILSIIGTCMITLHNFLRWTGRFLNLCKTIFISWRVRNAEHATRHYIIWTSLTKQ